MTYFIFFGPHLKVFTVLHKQEHKELTLIAVWAQRLNCVFIIMKVRGAVRVERGFNGKVRSMIQSHILHFTQGSPADQIALSVILQMASQGSSCEGERNYLRLVQRLCVTAAGLWLNFFETASTCTSHKHTKCTVNVCFRQSPAELHTLCC